MGTVEREALEEGEKVGAEELLGREEEELVPQAEALAVPEAGAVYEGKPEMDTVAVGEAVEEAPPGGEAEAATGREGDPLELAETRRVSEPLGEEEGVKRNETVLANTGLGVGGEVGECVEEAEIQALAVGVKPPGEAVGGAPVGETLKEVKMVNDPVSVGE